MGAVPVGAQEEEEMPPRMVGTFYQAVVASVQIYGSESWVVSPAMMRELMEFHVQAMWQLTGIHPQKAKGNQVYPHSADILAAAHLQPIEYYIQKRQHTVHNKIRDHGVLKE